MGQAEEIAEMNSFGEYVEMGGDSNELTGNFISNPEVPAEDTGQTAKASGKAAAGSKSGKSADVRDTEGSSEHGGLDEVEAEHVREDEQESGSQGGDTGGEPIQPTDGGDGDGDASGASDSELARELEAAKSRERELQRQIEDLRASTVKDEPKRFELDDEDFLADLEVEDISEMGKESFNKILNKAYKSGAAKAYEAALKDMPNLIRSSLQQQMVLYEAANRFYSDNPDLVDWKSQVTLVAEELLAKNPDWRIDKLFTETEQETRKRLSLPKKGGGEKGKVTKPALMGKPKGGTPKEAPKASPLQAEIDAMNNFDI